MTETNTNNLQSVGSSQNEGHQLNASATSTFHSSSENDVPNCQQNIPEPGTSDSTTETDIEVSQTMINRTQESDSDTKEDKEFDYSSNIRAQAYAMLYEELNVDAERPYKPEYALKIRRDKTYSSWPEDHPIRPEELSTAGFYYAGQPQMVKCFHCKLNLLASEFPCIEHARISPFCGFLRKLVGKQFITTVQYFVRKQKITLGLVKAKMGKLPLCLNDEVNHVTIKKDPFVFTIVDICYSGKLNINELTSINFDGFFQQFGDKDLQRSNVLKYLRDKTFYDWPLRHMINHEELSAAGFYFTGVEDVVACFSCDALFRKWKRGLNAWILHTDFYPNCAFLKQVLGQHFIDTVQNFKRENEITLEKVKAQMGYLPSCLEPLYFKRPVDELKEGEKEQNHVEECKREQTPEASGTSDAQNNLPTEISLKSICKICMGQAVEIAFLPCGHLVSCFECSCLILQCPVCRQQIQGTVKIIIS